VRNFHKKNDMKQKIVVLSGAGMSAESGIKTFRDANGLWENHDVMEVASPEGWRKNRDLVLEFYNQRRRQLFEVKPNAGHEALVELESLHQVHVVTQNVDDLHERAGSTDVLHLHGELLKARSTLDERLIYEWKKDILPGDKCERGSQLRPHIVWFGELVPMLEPAARLVNQADIAIIIGTSMQVYPAASLIGYAKTGTRVFYIDPRPALNFELRSSKNLQVIAENATTGVRKVVDELMK
jgi:NAD-dependent deacetylase